MSCSLILTSEISQKAIFSSFIITKNLKLISWPLILSKVNNSQYYHQYAFLHHKIYHSIFVKKCFSFFQITSNIFNITWNIRHNLDPFIYKPFDPLLNSIFLNSLFCCTFINLHMLPFILRMISTILLSLFKPCEPWFCVFTFKSTVTFFGENILIPLPFQSNKITESYTLKFMYLSASLCLMSLFGPHP